MKTRTRFKPSDLLHTRDEWLYVIAENESPCDSTLREIRFFVLGESGIRAMEYLDAEDAVLNLSATLYRIP